MLATGMRFREAAALRWADVDLDARLVHVRHTLGVRKPRPDVRRAQDYQGSPPGPCYPRSPSTLWPCSTTRANGIAPPPATAGTTSTWSSVPLPGRPLSQSHPSSTDSTGVLAEARPSPPPHARPTPPPLRPGSAPRAVQHLLGHSRFEITMNLYTASVPKVLREAADKLDLVFANARTKRREG